MADSAVQISAGTGTNIDTRTEGTNGNHRQVVVLGDPGTNTGVAPVDAVAGLKIDLGADNDVAVTSLIPGSGATNLGKAEDAAHTSGDVGVMALSVRQDTAAALAGTDGDYQPLVTDSAGRLHTTVAVVTPGTAASSLGKAEDAAHTTGDVGVMALAVRSDTPADRSGTDGDYEPPQVKDGRLWTRARGFQDSGGTDITDATAHALRITAVDSAGAAVATNVAATTDTITAKLATDAIQNGTTALTPKFAKIAASASGDNTLVAAVVGKKIRVLGYNLMGNGAVNAKFQSGAAGNDLTGLKYLAAAGGGISVPFNPVGWFETAVNTLLNLNLSGAVAVGGELVYVEV